MTSLLQIIQVVKAVQEAKKRIDFPVRPGVTFFSESDVWQFQAVVDTKTCDVCSHLDMQDFRGNELRTKFPFLDVIDEGMIQAHVHPNCRCFMNRFEGEPEKE